MKDIRTSEMLNKLRGWLSRVLRYFLISMTPMVRGFMSNLQFSGHSALKLGIVILFLKIAG